MGEAQDARTRNEATQRRKRIIASENEEQKIMQLEEVETMMIRSLFEQRRQRTAGEDARLLQNEVRANLIRRDNDEQERARTKQVGDSRVETQLRLQRDLDDYQDQKFAVQREELRAQMLMEDECTRISGQTLERFQEKETPYLARVRSEREQHEALLRERFMTAQRQAGVSQVVPLENQLYVDDAFEVLAVSSTCSSCHVAGAGEGGDSLALKSGAISR